MAIRFAHCRFPNLSRFLGLKKWKRFVFDESGRGLQSAVTTILLLNSACILLESIQDLSNENFLHENAWGWIEFGFSLVYAVELSLKLATIPFDKYWLEGANRFDFFVTNLLLVVSIVWVSPSIIIPQEALRYFTILRLLRLLELVKQTKRFNFIFTCLASMAQGCVPVILSVFVATAMFSILGGHLYGGLVYGTNPDLEDSGYFADNLDVLNFNDFGMSLMTFAGMIVSGGPVTNLIEGFGLVGPGGHALSTVFFFTNYYFVILVLFNVFIAFIIDAFMVGFSSQNMAEKGVEEGRDGLDTTNLPVEEGFEVIKNKAKGSDKLYKAMFEKELKEILGEGLS